MKTNSKLQAYWFETSNIRIFGLIALIFLSLPIRQGFSFSEVAKQWQELKQEWQELKCDHFLVYFTQDERFAKKVSHKAEVYYRRIAPDLGYARYDNFWTWDNRVKIYIYSDHASYLKSTGQPEWSQGMADYNKKQIAGIAASEGFLESVLPHEIAHLIFRDFVGFKSDIPIWLDEGVAQWAEEAKRREIKLTVKRLFEEDTLISLEDMMKINLSTVTKEKLYIRSTRTRKGDRSVVLLSGDHLVATYYIQSVSLVDFLIEKYGSNSFAEFCRELRDGKTLEEALGSAYPTRINNLVELEDRWREYLEKE